MAWASAASQDSGPTNSSGSGSKEVVTVSPELEETKADEMDFGQYLSLMHHTALKEILAEELQLNVEAASKSEATAVVDK